LNLLEQNHSNGLLAESSETAGTLSAPAYEEERAHKKP